METSREKGFVELPLINCIHKIVVYETKARFYVVGSNHTENVFRVLKIDRTEPRELHIVDDQVEYTSKEIRDLLLMIDVGNRARGQVKDSVGLARTVSAFGLVGFVQFLEGYYMILITKRRKVAQVGSHTLYKIEDTAMIYIPNATVRYMHPDEQKYVKMFQNVDLSSNFYFSYSYDLTRTLQYHMTPCVSLDEVAKSLPERKHVTLHPKSGDVTSRHDVTQLGTKRNVTDRRRKTSDIEDAKDYTFDVADGNLFEMSENIKSKAVIGASKTQKISESKSDADVTDIFEDAKEEPATFSEQISAAETETETKENKCTDTENSNESKSKAGRPANVIYGIRTEPEWKYVWNRHLLKGVAANLHSDWLLYITHGFIGQSNMHVFGKSLYLTLIARRSNLFAGTRFLKRGANLSGHVANEVETEQIVHDASASDLRRARVTSFTQLRGSLPAMWSQDLSKMVPKPSIEMDQADPYGFIAGQHFNNVLARYGTPLIILNLVKKRERKRHEHILTENIVKQIDYLNQFLPDDHRIRYIGFDMARGSKNKDFNVLERLATIAEFCVKKTGFFHSGPKLHCNTVRPHSRASGLNGLAFGSGSKQRGVVRTNCVDCLDRTNTAQFALGKCALAFQLYVLGIIHTPNLEFETDCVRMLEELYEDQGDTLALQYGGSQLVHRIKGYRNVAHWTSSSKDIMQTLSRYYSNAFSDTEKQQAINVFLGVFTPKDGQSNIWELSTDFYLHNPAAAGLPLNRHRNYSQWWDGHVFRSLPYAAEEALKGRDGRLTVLKTVWNDERVNQYWDFYQPYSLTYLGEHYSLHMPHSVRDFMPKFATNSSPFALRVQPGRREEEYGNTASVNALVMVVKGTIRSKSTEVNPNISGKDSTSSTLSAGSDGSSTSSDTSDIDGDMDESDSDESQGSDVTTGYVSFQDLFATMKQCYGVDLKEPEPPNIAKYKRYVQIGQNSCRPIEKTATPSRYSTELIQKSIFALDSTYSVEPPTVTSQSRDVYEKYVARARHGASEPNGRSKLLYQQYVSNQHL